MGVLNSLYFLLFAFLFLSPLGANSAAIESETEESKINYRLPGTTIPELYELTLTISPDVKDQFSGHVKITGHVEADTAKIVLNANVSIKFQDISVKKVSSDHEMMKTWTTPNEDTSIMEIELNDALKAGDEFVVEINYIGHYGNKIGLFLITYLDGAKEKHLATTQFESIYAREVFPCYDEPQLKANFILTIYHPNGYNAISNMAVNPTAEMPEKEGYIHTTFEKTPKISSYLLGFLVSDFESTSNYNEGPGIHRLKFNMYSRPSEKQYSRYAMEYAQKYLATLELYINQKFDSDKLDFAAIPVIKDVGNENGGAILVQEDSVLFDEETGSVADEMFVSSSLCHHIMHLAFGYKVTPEWWDYSWMNEGFANFLEYFLGDMVTESKFRMMDEFVVNDIQSNINYDDLESADPITFSSESPDSIKEIYLSDSYVKAGAIIRMMFHIMGEKNFKTALQNYFEKLSDGVTKPSLLYEEFQKVLEKEEKLPSDVTVSNILGTWTTNAGFPTISAMRKDGQNTVKISQKRVVHNDDTERTDMWYVPITFAKKSESNFDETSKIEWLKPDQVLSMKVDDEDDWFIVNKQQMGYFRVKYDEKNWDNLIKALKSDDFDGIHYLNRAQLIDDAYYFADNFQLNFKKVFDLLSYLEKEQDYIPFITASRVINNIYGKLPADSFSLFKKFLLKINKNKYEDFTFKADSSDVPIRRLHRSLAIDLQCKSDSEEVVTKSNEEITKWMKDPEYKINSDLKTAVLCCGMKNATEKQWDFILTKYLAEKYEDEKETYLYTLGCVVNRDLVKKYLSLAIDEHSAFNADSKTAIISMIKSGNEQFGYTLDFFRDNFDKLENKSEYLGLLGHAANLDEHFVKIQALYDKYYSTFESSDQTAFNSTLETMNSKKNWCKELLPDMNEWLSENESSNEL